MWGHKMWKSEDNFQELCESQELNSGRQTWWQVPLSSEPSPGPEQSLKMIVSFFLDAAPNPTNDLNGQGDAVLL